MRAALFARFDELAIKVDVLPYPEHDTIEEGKLLRGDMDGTFTKNLLLKDKKGRVFLVAAHEDRDVDLKTLHAGSGRRGVWGSCRPSA